MNISNDIIDQQKSTFGSRLKARRKAKEMTLTQLSELSSVSASTISKIENDAVSPTYEVILKLANGLSSSMSEMFGEPAPAASSERTPQGWQVIGRKGQGERLETDPYDYLYLCSELRTKAMVPCIVRIKAGTLSEFGHLTRHHGEEFIYVLQGSIELHTEFYTPSLLNAGDFAYIDSTMGHAYLRASEEDALVLGVCAGGDFNENA